MPPAVQETVRALVDLSPVLTELGDRFTRAGFEVHLVGGSVRDALLAAEHGAPRVPGDLDVTTDARPEQVLELLRGWAGSTWNTGIAFGTVGAEVSGVRLEITTYRADRYDRESRNPEVAWGTSLVDDLVRRDFTVNAIAVSPRPPKGSVTVRSGPRDTAMALTVKSRRTRSSTSDVPQATSGLRDSRS